MTRRKPHQMSLQERRSGNLAPNLRGASRTLTSKDSSAERKGQQKWDKCSGAAAAVAAAAAAAFECAQTSHL